MGSPYSVSVQVNRVHVVKTFSGLLRVLKIVKTSMNCSQFDKFGPEWRTLDEIMQACNNARSTGSRTIVSLGARYDWHGSEKFGRVIIFDFSKSKRAVDTYNGEQKCAPEAIEWKLIPFDFTYISQLI